MWFCLGETHVQYLDQRYYNALSCRTAIASNMKSWFTESHSNLTCAFVILGCACAASWALQMGYWDDLFPWLLPHANTCTHVVYRFCRRFRSLLKRQLFTQSIGVGPHEIWLQYRSCGQSV